MQQHRKVTCLYALGSVADPGSSCHELSFNLTLVTCVCPHNHPWFRAAVRQPASAPDSFICSLSNTLPAELKYIRTPSMSTT